LLGQSYRRRPAERMEDRDSFMEDFPRLTPF
jgi:hypothetical protein